MAAQPATTSVWARGPPSVAMPSHLLKTAAVKVRRQDTCRSAHHIYLAYHDPEGFVELVQMKRQLKKLVEEAEARQKAELRDELASRTLAALDDRLFAGLDQNEQDALRESHRIDDFAGIRKGKTKWEIRTARARRDNEPSPPPTDFDLAVQRVWVLSHVQPHWALIRTLEGQTTNEGFFRSPAPARADFLAYAEALRLPDDVRDDLAVRECWAQGAWEPFFTP
ncbi:hypothetical protein DFH09DRAFT_1470095 [Mycena vulgaris]|nr:hypothetical protein DFH09DRAFT_1470095 [Mycena vulgaris]